MMDVGFVQGIISTGPLINPSSSARPRLTAISASPFELSYQKAVPGGRDLTVAIASLAPRPKCQLRSFLTFALVRIYAMVRFVLFVDTVGVVILIRRPPGREGLISQSASLKSFNGGSRPAHLGHGSRSLQS